MTDDLLSLAAEFDAVSHDDWMSAVNEVLKGRRFEEALISATADGIGVEPLYVRDDARPVAQFPMAGTSRRASNAAGSTQGWDIRQRHGLWSTESALNAAVLADLERGVTSIELVDVDNADLGVVLQGVHLDLAPIALNSADDGTETAKRFLALAASRELAPSTLRADLGCDPIGRLAQSGVAGPSTAEPLSAVGSLARDVSASHPLVRTVRADGMPFANAGATPATELAAVLGSGLAYLRAMVDVGLDVAEALSQILLRVSVGTDQFGDIAKLRALRVLWARIAEVVAERQHVAAVQAATSPVVATQRDPWVNILRTTIGCFSAAVGGADIVTTDPFDAAVGVPDELGVRIARNTQLALLDESNLHRVIDPAGGSWYVEALTDHLADVAWAAFQDLERQGGIVASLNSGELHSRIRAQAQAQAERVATRDRPIVGVTEFANLDEPSLARSPHPSQAARGARRLAAGFELLRDHAEAASPPPTVFLANLGPPSAHISRARWAKNYFAAGGVGSTSNNGFDSADTLAAGFADDPSEIAVLCSSDDVYTRWGAEAASALRAGGAKRIYLAGRPREHRHLYEAAGVDEFIYVGSDVLAGLRRAHAALGVGAGDLT